MTQNHIIYRQNVRTHVVGNSLQATEVQQRVGDLMQSPRYLKALGDMLNEFGRAGEWLELDKIELNIESLNIEDLERDLIPKLTNALRQKLYDAIPDAVLQGKTVTKSTQQFDFEAFLEFLKQGVFTSFTPHKLGYYTHFEDWVNAIVEALTEKQIQALTTLLKNNKTAQQRLFSQISEKAIVLIFSKIHQDTLLSILTLKKLKLLFLPEEALIFEILIDDLFFRIMEKDTAWLKRFEDFVKTIMISKTSKTLQRKEVLNFISAEAPPQYFDRFEGKKNEQQSSRKIEKESIFIQNAGIVLLNPFLQTCFDACGWLIKDGFKNSKTQHKALQMLHFLATGETQAAEFDLFLPKILCNVPENAPILRGRDFLTKKEKAEGESLLQAAIEHWQVLKNTSPDGLREAFLQREGKLERNPFGGWTLTVEQKAQDILLSQLPYGWGVSLVKLDWMKEILQVNWA